MRGGDQAVWHVRSRATETTPSCHHTAVSMTIIKVSKLGEGWGGRGERGPPAHRWWECKLVWPLWETV